MQSARGACSVEDALKLLEGPSDEHKFAGLLLVPHLCAESGSVRHKQLYDSLGLDFLWRLLVPLRDPRFIATIDDSEEVQKQLLGVTLSLSVLSILTREPSVALDPELISLFPCLSRVLRANSLAEACGKQRPSEGGEPPSEASDAVEIVWNICTHEQEAMRVALESRLLSSIAAWLSRSFLVQPSEVLNCGLSLLFIIAQPLLQSGDGFLQWYTDKVSFPPELLGSEVRAAVEGLSYVCSVDCSLDSEDHVRSAQPSAEFDKEDPGTKYTDNSNKPENMPDSAARKELQLHSFSVLAALLPVMERCPDHFAPANPDASDGRSAWRHKLQIAALRTLRNKLPEQHTTNVLLALHALTQQHGATSLLQCVEESDSSARATDLMLTIAQVVKVDIFAHLQGCALEVQVGRASQELPSQLRASHSSFIASIQMVTQLVDLAVLLDSVTDGMTEDGPCGVSNGDMPVVTTAAMEGTVTEVLFAIKDSVQAMLDFMLLCVRGDMVDGPEPEQIPKGFRRPEPVSPAGEAPQDTITRNGDKAAGSAQSKEVAVPDCPTPRDVSGLFMPSSPQADTHWIQEALQQCCQSVGCFLSMAGDHSLFLQLFQSLPPLCSWMLGNTGGALVESQPGMVSDLMKPLLPALYSVQVLHTSEPAVIDCCRKACQQPQVVVCMCICCQQMAESVCAESDESAVWKSHLLSPVETLCELIASVVSSAREVHASADALHSKLLGGSDTLMQKTSVTIHKLVNILAPALSVHANNCEDGDEVGPIVDAILSTAEFMLISASPSVAQHPGQQRWIEVVSSVAEALRISVEYILKVVQADYSPLLRSLVLSGHDSTSCWSAGGEHLLFACVTEDMDVSRVVDRSANLCAGLCECLQQQQTVSNLVCEQTWLQQWLQNNDQMYHLVGVLESSEETVSLGHALQLLAVALKS